MVRFGSSGVRGLVGRDITPELMTDLGRAVGTHVGSVLVGRDPRTTGEMLAAAFVAGVLASGADATDAGIASTPTVARAASDYAVGAVVTASHNPAPYNGLKLWNPDGLAFAPSQQEAIETAVDDRDFRNADWETVGSLYRRADLVARHKEAILRDVGSAHLRVVVDCGCGATATITPFVLREMGCEVVALNAQLDGRFPGRDPEPTEESLGALRKTVASLGADLGIAHDGDGDRMVAVDDRGRFVGGDRLLALFAKREVRRGLVVPVNASMVLDDLVRPATVWRTRVGDVFVAQEVRNRKADFGGEPSGTWIFPKVTLCPDGVYAAAHLATIVEGERLSEIIDDIPEYPIVHGSLPFDPARRAEVQAALEAALPGMGGAVLSVDGWRLGFDDGWALVRFSGTEPKLRITAEAREAGRAKEIYESVLHTAKAAL